MTPSRLAEENGWLTSWTARVVQLVGDQALTDAELRDRLTEATGKALRQPGVVAELNRRAERAEGQPLLRRGLLRKAPRISPHGHPEASTQ